MFMSTSKVMLYLFSCYFFIIAYYPAAVHSQFSLAYYDITNAVSFNGHPLNDSTCHFSRFPTREGVLECAVGSKLDDDDTAAAATGPLLDNVDSFFVFGGSENADPGVMEFVITSKAPNLSITLHFFNQPNNFIGLPEIIVKTVQAKNVPFVIADNNDLMQTDSTIRSIVLLLNPDSPINYVLLSFKFVNTSKINWVFISEVDITTITGAIPLNLSKPIIFQEGTSSFVLGPIHPPSNISLSCTVDSMGLFDWEWEYNGHPLSTPHSSDDYWIWTADTSRTTILDMNITAHSMGEYTCVVTHRDTDTQHSTNRTISVLLNVVVEASYFTDGSSVIIKCEAYGYLQSEDIILMRQETLIPPLDDKYIITNEEGEMDSVGINGSTRGSVVVKLEIKHFQESDYGIYSCIGHGKTTNIEINNVLLPAPSHSVTSHMLSSQSTLQYHSPTNEFIDTSSTSNAVLSIVLGVVGGAIVVSIISVFIILTIVVVKRKQKQKQQRQHNECQTPENNKHCEQVYSIVRKRGVDTSSHYENNDVVKECHYSVPSVDNHNPYYSTIHNDNHILPPYNSSTTLLNISSFSSGLEPVHYFSPRSPSVCKPDSPAPQYSEIDIIRNHSNKVAAELYVNGVDWEDESGYDHIPPLSGDGPGYDSLEPYKAIPAVTICPLDITELSVLGEGEFGEVVLAEIDRDKLELKGDDMVTDMRVKVAVKKLKDKVLKTVFEREMRFMAQLDHDNVVKLMAISGSQHELPFMVMEYMENRDLNQFLLWHEVSHSHPPTEQNQLSPLNLLSMAIQIANGLTYLASHNYIHRDVATRNCLVGEDNIVKIADFGLSRSLYDSVYYRVKGKAKMPIRWMATECFYGKFSQFSDVWAYGVTVWEIYTMARELPYSMYNDMEVIEDAIKSEHRQRLTRPHSCPKAVYDEIQESCFQPDYKLRATFATIHEHLCNIYDQLY